jgi:hypothetical protein
MLEFTGMYSEFSGTGFIGQPVFDELVFVPKN